MKHLVHHTNVKLEIVKKYVLHNVLTMLKQEAGNGCIQRTQPIKQKK